MQPASPSSSAPHGYPPALHGYPPALHGYPAAPPGLPTRHPLDPDPVPGSKAGAVLTLGIVAVLTGFFFGGLIPATVALVLARQAQLEMVEARGFLTGSRRLRVGVRLAWAGIALAGIGVVVVLVLALLQLADAAGARDFPPNVD